MNQLPMDYFDMTSSDKQFMSDIDRHVQNRIEEKLRQNPNYFTATIDANEIMQYLESVIIPSATREQILCLYRNEGNTNAVRKMVAQMRKFQNFGMSFLKALVDTGHRNLAEELISGFLLDTRNDHQGASFIREILRVSPPPYDPPPFDVSPFHDQQEKLSRFNSLHHNTDPSPSFNDSDTLSTIRSDDISLSNPSTSSTAISPYCPPPYGSLEQNLNFSNPSSTQTERDSASSTINNESVQENDNSTTRRPIPVEGEEEASMTNDAVSSDLHQSEFCVSGDARDTTIPKMATSQSQSSDFDNDVERLDAIPPSASAGTSTFDESTGSTHYEREERVIADSTHNMKNYSARKVENAEESFHDGGNVTSSADKDIPKEYLWEVGVALLAVMSVVVFLMKRK